MAGFSKKIKHTLPSSPSTEIIFLKMAQYWARCPEYRKPSLEILTRGGFLQIAGPFSASAVGDSFGKCGKGGPLPVDETAHIGSVSLNSIGRRAIFVKMLKKEFSLLL